MENDSYLTQSFLEHESIFWHAWDTALTLTSCGNNVDFSFKTLQLDFSNSLTKLHFGKEN